MKLKYIHKYVLEQCKIFLNRKVYASLRKSSNIHHNKRAFIVGTAPSLNKLDLSKLDGEIYFLANKGYKIDQLNNMHTPYYVVSDYGFYQKFATELLKQSDVGEYIFRQEFRQNKQMLPSNINPKGKYTYIPYRSGGILKRGFQTDVVNGVGHDSSVLLFAVHAAYYMGIKDVYIIGCDLDYSSSNAYAYKMNEDDHKLNNSSATKHKRNWIGEVTNKEFAAADKFFRRKGGGIYNAGVGGKLDSIEKVDFNSLF